MNDNVLRLPHGKPGQLRRISSPIRFATIQEAISFPLNPNGQDKRYTSLYSHGDYRVKAGKPGKEFDSLRIRYNNGTKGNNPNDMSPTIFRNDKIIARNGSFEEVFRQFVSLVTVPKTLELIGCLCVRNAFTLDHRQNEEGNWRYSPPHDIIDEINSAMPQDFPEPIEVFLYYLELIALNEDVKYNTLGYDITNGTGRENNLLTYAHVIHILLLKGKVTDSDFLLAFIKFAGGMARLPTGINALSVSSAIQAFPLLKSLQ